MEVLTLEHQCWKLCRGWPPDNGICSGSPWVQLLEWKPLWFLWEGSRLSRGDRGFILTQSPSAGAAGPLALS